MRRTLPGFWLGVTFLSLMAAALHAEEWHRLGNYRWNSRLAVLVENPCDEPLAHALVRLPMKDLPRRLPDNLFARSAGRTAGLSGKKTAQPGHVGVVDPEARSVRLGESGGTLIPFQEYGGDVVFGVSLRPHEKKRVYIYTSREAVPAPVFEKKTATDVRAAYRSFENNLMGFRFGVGPGANTTGMAIDLFGKTAEGRGLQLRRFFAFEQEQCPMSYHKPSRWGMDVLHIGSSSGLGGVHLFAGGQTARPDSKQTSFEVLTEGPILSVVRVSAPVEIAGRKITVVRTVSMTADDRSLEDTVEVQGEPQALDGLLVGIGLNRLQKEESWKLGAEGYAYVAGSQGAPDVADVREIGLGVVFDPKAYVRTEKLDGEDGAHVVVLRPQSAGNGRVSRHRLAAYWDRDGEVASREDFEQALRRWARVRGTVPVVGVMGNVEHRKSDNEKPGFYKKPGFLFVAVNPTSEVALLPPSTALEPGTAPPRGGQTGQRQVFADARLGPLAVREVSLRQRRCCRMTTKRLL